MHRRSDRATPLPALAACLLVSTALVSPSRAASPTVFSLAWFAAHGAGSAAAARAGAATAATGSLQQVQQSMANLQRAAQAISAAQTAQAAARAAALALPPAVPDGLAPGALQPLPGAAAGSASWQGASLPVQSGPAQRPVVTVRQGARQAVLTWQTFNVGRNTTLAFDQSAGGAAANTWVALNRVEDPQALPSQILGSITAPGQVYVINRNGVIFGATAQVNTGALVASAAELNTSGFLRNGLYSANATTPAFTGATGAITVQAGAQITTALPASANTGGGFVLLLGTRVTNAGEISAPGGQAAMAAGRDFVVLPGFGSSSNADPQATVQGNQVAVTAGGGAVTNAGLMQASDGDITLVGHSVTQAGVIAASTGLGQRGTVHLLTDFADQTASVVLAPGSVTAITIDSSSDTAIEALRAQGLTTAGTSPLNTYAGLPDVRDLSRIEVTSGGSVSLGADSLAVATAGQIAIAAKGTVLMAPGASADVSGLVGVSLPQSANLFQVSVEPYNLRDSPVNRDTGFLSSQSVSVDARTLLYVPPENGDSSARYYTGGGLLEVSGELGNVGHTVAEYATTGGTVDIQAGSVIAQPGSGINLAGGSIAYQAGPVAQTWLLGSDGLLHNLNSATDAVAYTGVFNGFAESHPHWGVTETFTNPLIAPASIEESAYTVGHNAGSLVISAPTTLFAGAITAGIVTGARQTTQPVSGETGLLVGQTAVPQGGTLDLANLQLINGSGNAPPQLLFQPGTSDVTIGAVAPDTAALTARSRLSRSQKGQTQFSAAALDNSGLSSLLIDTTGSITVAAPLSVADGGSITLQAPAVTVAASVTARSGSVKLGAATLGQTAVTRGVRSVGVTIDHGATIDVRGVWTNALLQPGATATEAWINGGSVTAESAGSFALSSNATLEGGVTLAAGSAIDASAGGFIGAGGSITGGAGGSIALLSDIAGSGPVPVTPGPAARRDLVLDGALRSIGYSGGGTLTLQAPGIAIGDGLTPGYAGELLLPPSLLASGFSNYVLTSATGIRVAPGAQVSVIEPVYESTALSASVPSGSDPDAALQIWLPPLYFPEPENARLLQRVGASLTLDAPGELPAVLAVSSNGQANLKGPRKDYGSISLGAGSAISAEPGRAVVLDASLGATVAGSITAPGGTIEILDPDTVNSSGLNQALGQHAITIASTARLDVSGAAATAPDLRGRPYGIVTAGGTITLGNTPGVTANGQQNATDAPIVIAPGAVLDASGASAVIDLDAGLAAAQAAPVADATAGGTIRLASYTAIAADGALRAAPGGAGAAGGTLDVVLETGIYAATGAALEDPYLATRRIVVSQSPAPPAASVPIGVARLSADAIAAGGFGTVSLFAHDAIEFQGNVSLAVGQAITLQEGALAETVPGAHVALTAPYVLLSGNTGYLQGGVGIASPYWDVPWSQPSRSVLTVQADQIDLQNAVTLGATGQPQFDLSSKRPAPLFSAPGFGAATLDSSGAIRFLTGTSAISYQNLVTSAATAGTPGSISLLVSYGDLLLSASQVFPVTGATAEIDAGLFDARYFGFYHGASGAQVNLYEDHHSATLRFETPAGASGSPALSVFGTLAVNAPTIEQGGILEAPFGSISVGVPIQSASGIVTPTSVSFLPGSLTSVSADGLSIPYGGTADGITYDYEGQAAAFQYSTNGGPTASQRVIYGMAVAGQALAVDAGATLDLRGGGTLTGAGFVSGRGGSADALEAPLLSFTGKGVAAATPSAADAIYALLPDNNGAYAPPAQPDAGGAYPTSLLPGIGQTVTLGGGIPGLPAGTYTLLPSYYALQPGGYRIELRSATTFPTGAAEALPDGSFLAAARTGIANTGVLAAVPTAAIITPGGTVRRYSQYDEQSYSSFAVSQAPVSVFGNLRPVLPEDAGELDLAFGPNLRSQPALVNDGAELLQAAPGGFGGTLAVYPANSLDSLVIGAADTRARQQIVVDAAALDAVHPATMVVGAGVSVQVSVPSVSAPQPQAQSIEIYSLSNGLTLDPGAILTAPQILLASDGAITFAATSTVEALPGGAAFLDSTSGLRFAPGDPAESIVGASTGVLLLAPPVSGNARGKGITVDGRAALLASGSLALESAKPISVSDLALLGARDFDVTATAVNIGDTSIAPVPSVPPGLQLSQNVLDTLLRGDPALGIPALQTLDLTASQSVNFYGTTQLNAFNPATGQSSLNLFVLNTPGLYGYGEASDLAVLNVGTLYWNGASTEVFNTATASPSVIVSAPPLVSAGGPGTGAGTLDITAQTLVFGFGPNDVPQAISAEPRAIFGFGTVNLTATQQIVAANLGTLLVYQSQGSLQPNGTLSGSGGALNIATPLLTAAANGTLDVTAGGALTILPAGAAPSLARPNAAGGEIGFTAASIDDASAIVLPSGRALLAGQSGVTLEPGARIDVAGESQAVFGQTVSGAGGTVLLNSAAGDVTALAGSSIAFGGAGAQAGGSLAVTAATGNAALGGALLGGGGDAADSGAFTLDAATLPDFAGLNQALTAGGVFGARRFEIGTGNLSIESADALRAHAISVALDGGSLTVDGLIDASGASVGTIALAAGTGLTLTGSAVLAAQGSVLAVDSYGQPIDAENRAEVSLTSAAGTLALQPGAAIGLASADGIARGDLELDAPRATATGGAIGIAAAGPLAITGAATIALNGFWSYHPADGAIVQSNLGKGGKPVDANGIGLDQISADSAAFEAAALGDPATKAAVTGLAAYGAAFYLRPGAVIDSAATPDGNLTVDGDLDLSGLRYGPGGEPGVLVLRAAGDLGVYGSISDGFKPPPATPDDAGWMLARGLSTQAVTVLAPVTLAPGTVLPNADLALGYAVAVQAGATLNAGMAAPVAVTLAAAVKLTQAWTLTAPVTLPGGSTLPAGDTLPAGTKLPAKAVLGTGSVLPDAFTVAQIDAWPGNASLAVFAAPVQLAGKVTLQPGQTIPGGTTVQFSGKTRLVPTRPAGQGGAQGQVDALAAMLPAGSLSWSIGLTAGANLTAAATDAVLPLDQLATTGSAVATGDILLDDPHYGAVSSKGKQGPEGFSVIRTGTGSLTLAAGGSIEQQSPFGIYTAGTEASGVKAEDRPAAIGAKGVSGGSAYAAVIRQQLRDGDQPYYPTDGGDLSVRAQGSVALFYGGTGGFFGGGPGDGTSANGNAESASLGWLWEQGTGTSTASYWINFGSYQQTDQLRPPAGAAPAIVGFTGFGTLGGGDLTLQAGGNLGAVADPLVPGADGLVAAIGSTGRVTSVRQTGTVVTGGSLLQTGGGALRIVAGGAVLGPDVASTTSPALLTDTRGAITVSAGSVGVVQPIYGSDTIDPRFITSVTNAETAYVNDGITLAIGDGIASVTTRGDLSLADAVDPGREGNNFFIQPGGSGGTADVLYTGFSLWSSGSGINLLSAGGNLAPNSNIVFAGAASHLDPDGLDEYPPVLSASAQHGSIYFVQNPSGEGGLGAPVELAPSASQSLALLASSSIYGPAVIAASGAPAGANDVPNPFKPAYAVSNGTALVGTQTNASDVAFLGTPDATGLFAFEFDTPAGPAAQPGAQPFRIYAGSGDIVNLTVGQVATVTTTGLAQWYTGSLPTQIIAGGDLVNFGQPGNNAGNQGFGLLSGGFGSAGLLVNDGTADVSVIQAGRDIIYANADVAGPGLLFVQAGRNVYQGSSGSIASLGQQVVNQSIPPSDSTGGASVTVLTGAGAAGPDWSAFADLYFNDANQANLSLLLTDPANAGKVQQTYSAALLTWLQQTVGYPGDQSGALAAFLALPVPLQSEFTLPVYFDELRLSGRQFNDPGSRFYKSYARGKQAIAALFPGQDYQGGLTMFGVPQIGKTPASASAITTNYGGAITILTPGGGTSLGTTTPGVFPSPYGVITFGQGDVDIYSLGSVLLGTSRIFTTFGGGITIWSAQGDINAGQGTKSAVVAQPFSLSYDPFGDVTLSPQAPSTGAGIATLNEIPGTQPGDVDLVAPQGTIDAGEAGIRSSGNANLAALAVSNAANIQVQGKTTGTPVIATPNIGALNAAAAVSSAAENSAVQQAAQQQPVTTGSIITVEVLGFGG